MKQQKEGPLALLRPCDGGRPEFRLWPNWYRERRIRSGQLDVLVDGRGLCRIFRKRCLASFGRRNLVAQRRVCKRYNRLFDAPPNGRPAVNPRYAHEVLAGKKFGVLHVILLSLDYPSATPSRLLDRMNR